ncbi:MAG: chemotaxis response regulator protein-glutamate methylesterase [Cyclobacteriaceae bacterium]
MSKIKVLIVDDSALTRSVLTKILNADADIEVIATAIDPIFAAKKIQTVQPDVITLDLEMPRMDGLSFLKRLMSANPRPVIVISGNSPKSSKNAIKALEYGAVEIIEKPDISSPEKLNEVSQHICESIKAASQTSPKNEMMRTTENDAVSVQLGEVSSKVCVIGSSTGGPDVLRTIFQKVNRPVPGFVVAQHMPALFTKSFAERLNAICQLHVKEAEDGEYIEQGKVLILPGDFHGVIRKDREGNLYIRLIQSEKVNRHRPSIDVLFDSAAREIKNSVTGIILTGMGEDGAAGLKKIRNAGGLTIAQDAESSVVFGMPKRAIEQGAVQYIMNPSEIVGAINQIKEVKNTTKY